MFINGGLLSAVVQLMSLAARRVIFKTLTQKLEASSFRSQFHATLPHLKEKGYEMPESRVIPYFYCQQRSVRCKGACSPQPFGKGRSVLAQACAETVEL